jgi:hypothetical protein
MNVAVFLHMPLPMPSQLLQVGILLGLFSTLKMEVIRSPIISVHIRNTQQYIPEDNDIQLYFCFRVVTSVSLR